jgi:hypothetical protein
MSYRNLEVWRLSRKLSILIHKMSFTLPRFELYETGSQIQLQEKANICGIPNSRVFS